MDDVSLHTYIYIQTQVQRLSRMYDLCGARLGSPQCRHCVKQLVMFIVHMHLHAGAWLREWLLYFSLPVLHGILPSSNFNHYYLVASVHSVGLCSFSGSDNLC